MKISKLFVSMTHCFRNANCCMVDIKRVDNQVVITMPKELLDMFSLFIERQFSPEEAHRVKRQITLSISPEHSNSS